MVPQAMKEAMEKRADPAVNEYNWLRPSAEALSLPAPDGENPTSNTGSLYQARIEKLTGHSFDQAMVCNIRCIACIVLALTFS